MNVKEHWEKVYANRPPAGASWYQPVPETSLHFLSALGVKKDDPVIDVGGGDSFLVDHLLDRGYTDITVLDISDTAIDKAKKRLGAKAGRVKWIACDITGYVPERQFECWHDRATFHFLMKDEEINKYLSVANNALSYSGKMILGTFSESGPDQCSGLPVHKYSEASLSSLFSMGFDKIECLPADHITPAGAVQHFLFCSFKKHQKQ